MYVDRNETLHSPQEFPNFCPFSYPSPPSVQYIKAKIGLWAIVSKLISINSDLLYLCGFLVCWVVHISNGSYLSHPYIEYLKACNRIKWEHTMGIKLK